MIPQIDRTPYLIATVESGTLVIRLSGISANWVPKDVVSRTYNVAGALSVGEFDTLEEARRVAEERYSIPPEAWKAVGQLPFEDGGGAEVEIHTPEVDGHNILRHGIHWK